MSSLPMDHHVACPRHEEKSALLHELQADRRQNSSNRTPPSRYRHTLAIVLALCFTAAGTLFFRHAASHQPSGTLASCAWESLEPHVAGLAVPPIARDEFLSRQATLAQLIDHEGVDAFVAEPSASTAYYANISANFGLSERPFLMIISKNGSFSYLVPQFEAGRVANLQMVYQNATTIGWAEEESPYEVFARETGFSRIMLDEQARYMIATGLQKAGIEVVPTSVDIQSLRAVKTESELAILRAINVFTVDAIRSIQRCIRPGITKATVLDSLQALFTRAGVGQGFSAIVLFGDQAAYPHGGVPDRSLGRDEYVLIDAGSKLYGYTSDVTRTFLPKSVGVSKELRHIWDIVYRSQSAAIEHMHANETCSDVDKASRDVVRDAGYGVYFTHRLGHGLGLEVHEHPYLNGANREKLRIGEVVTNEPGIYVTNEQASSVGSERGFGVRIEDPILVTENGGIPLTGRRARSPHEP